MSFDNYSGPVLVKSIEALESLQRPLPGPIHNTLSQLRTALNKKNESDLRAIPPSDLSALLDAYKDSMNAKESE